MDDIQNTSPEVVVLKFADSKVPVFKESKNKDYIKYGQDNNYPEYLNYLFDKSAKHNAIINGKANYIYGNGYENGDFIINRLGESLNDIARMCILDRVLYSGWRVEVIWNALGKISEIYHVDYNSLRTGKECGFYFKEAWTVRGAYGQWMENTREQEEFIPAFNPKNPIGSQIYAYNEYRPGVRFYPLPEYLGSNNYIETDIEISKFYLSSIRNGMMPSKMVQFFNGEPTEDKKKEIERRFTDKFTGAENGGRIVLVFNADQTKKVDVSDLSANELDKMFVELNKTVQQEIFSGHGITSPMLFGIKTEGQLGGSTELMNAYSIFKNTYAKPKASDFNREINYLLAYSQFAGQYELQPTDPIEVQIDVHDIVNSLPKQYVFEYFNVPKEMWGLENIGSDNKPTPTTPIPPSKTISAPSAESADPIIANDNLKNLSAKQHQQLKRIIREYSKGILTEAAARTLLASSLGLSDTEIDNLLGIEHPIAQVMSADIDYDKIVSMFDGCGDTLDDFEIIKSKRVSFCSDMEMEADEAVYLKEAFKTYDVTRTEDRILELIRKDKRITPEVIASTIGQSVPFVESKLKELTTRGYLETSIEKIGEDEITEWTIPASVQISAPPPISGSTPPTQIFVKYSYEVKPGVGPVLIPTSRPFCRKMIALNRLYSRADIEQISQRLGYSVFDRKGGWWGHNPECRHRWVSNIVIKKGGEK